MAVQAVIDEQLGAVLQRRLVVRLDRRVIEMRARRSPERVSGANSSAIRNFFILSLPYFIVTRSGTGLNLSMLDHQGIRKKNAK